MLQAWLGGGGRGNSAPPLGCSVLEFLLLIFWVKEDGKSLWGLSERRNVLGETQHHQLEEC